MTIFAILLDRSDNVATVLADTSPGTEVFLKGTDGSVNARSRIAFGHKIAVRAIPKGGPILKYGQPIGTASVDIVPGEWVHLHNMASALDASFRERIGR